MCRHHTTSLLHVFALLLSLFSGWSPALICAASSSSSSTITHLPGFSGPLPFQLETGYVGIEDGIELFYYFIKSERSPREDPLLLWLSGGPGCSSFSGLAFEIGPLKFQIAKYNGSLPSLFYNPYSWTKVSNIIFLDSPVGTGFSFSRRPKDYEVGDISSSKQVYEFLVKWFVDHPEFVQNPLYIGGDSYAGKVVPIVAHKISKGIEDGNQPLLNLKGYLIGNPATGENSDFNARVPYAHGVGIISDELFESAKRNCEGEDYQHPSNAHCALILNVVNKFISEIPKTHILDPKCVDALANTMSMNENRRSLEENDTSLRVPPPVPGLDCKSYANYLSYYWVNSNIVREALHIKKGTVPEWKRCKRDIVYAHDIPSSIKYHLSLTSRGYRALVYSGDHDIIIPFIGTAAWIRSLNFSIIDDWRSWHVGGQIAGYTRTYSNNLTFATVKNGGHLAPSYQPKECLEMIRRWTSHKPL